METLALTARVGWRDALHGRRGEQLVETIGDGESSCKQEIVTHGR